MSARIMKSVNIHPKPKFSNSHVCFSSCSSFFFINSDSVEQHTPSFTHVSCANLLHKRGKLQINSIFNEMVRRWLAGLRRWNVCRREAFIIGVYRLARFIARRIKRSRKLNTKGRDLWKNGCGQINRAGNCQTSEAHWKCVFFWFWGYFLGKS